MLKEFKEFAMRGNVIDLAVGVIIGGAFGKIADSLIKDVLLPPLGMLTSGVDFTSLFISLDGSQHASLAAAREAGAPVIAYGAFINVILQFVLLAFAIFLLVKAINRLRREPEAPAPDTKPCPHCISSIPLAATRCPQCTSELAAVS